MNDPIQLNVTETEVETVRVQIWCECGGEVISRREPPLNSDGGFEHVCSDCTKQFNLPVNYPYVSLFSKEEMKARKRKISRVKRYKRPMSGIDKELNERTLKKTFKRPTPSTPPLPRR